MVENKIYEIRTEGFLSNSWSTWFDGMTIRHLDAGQTVLCGPIADQAALHGLFIKIRDLGLPLIEVKQIRACQQERNNATNNLLSEHE